jgi:hypothetical protein
MNQDLLNQLNSSNLSNDDIQNLLKALGQTSLGNKGKGLKMTAQDKNNLLSKLSNTTQSLVEKEDPTKNMTEEEKKNYNREELRRKLREKQGKFRESRCSKTILQKKYDENMNKVQQTMEVPQTEQTEQTEQQTEQTEQVDQKVNEEEQLEDFITSN